jgi:hypothetical protein
MSARWRPGKGCAAPGILTQRQASTTAVVLQAQGDLAAARLLYERALVIWEKVRAPSISTCLNNLSILLWTQGGDLAAARPLCERALPMRGK